MRKEIDKEKENLYKNFYQAVLSLETFEECDAFFEDILTMKELQDCSQRLEVAKLLAKKKTYQEISAEIGASTATITRVNRCIQYGRGGYQIVLDRLDEKEDSNDND